MAECENCNGNGDFECDEPSHDEDCEYCDNGVSECDECGGSGEVDDEDDDDE